MSEPPGVGRRVKFPYTYTAKIVQFPYQHYVKNQWIWRFYFIAFGLSLPLFYKLHSLANMPANKEKWAESKRKQMEDHH
ncbi:uncharacterized protein LOC126563434 [Anopheles maculipalpis]|uniref:uncharacterized protein LOC126563434 n=1 Tax=Anopheles maculipalpis TaxID=1496333 RepID=UPI0021592564|nr:uncharacterized protein LOC126563434 [Anopheles maculipalpis]